MAKIDKKAKWNEFSKVGDKFCIGGQEIFRIHKAVNGWVWFQTQKPKKNPANENILYGYVQGLESEWGSWYVTDMSDNMIEEIPKESWSNISSLASL